MAAFRKKPAQGLQLDQVYLDGSQQRAGFWSDDVASSTPLSSRRDIAAFAAAQSRPANDDGRRARVRGWSAPVFLGSRPFWTAIAATAVFSVLFALMTGFGGKAGLAVLLSEPGRYPTFWTGLALITGMVWMFALSAHRQAVNNEVLNRVLRASQKFQEPSALAEDMSERLNASFENLFADIDARMALLDERGAQLASRIEGTIHDSAAASDANTANMQNILAASEAQREALQRTGMMISTEVLPVLSKLETTVLSLETVAQGASGVLDSVGARLVQSTQDLKTCLDAFNNANHTVVPEIERRMHRFEAAIGQLPAQLEATIGRLAPMSETVADAAMLSTANIEVIEQLAKDITAALDSNRTSFVALSANGAEMFRDAAAAHAGHFREVLERTVAEEAGRVSELSRELDLLIDTAAAVVDRLRQPVSDVTSAADKALAGVSETMGSMEQRVEAHVAHCIAEMNDAAARVVTAVTRDIETTTTGLQTRLAATSTDIMQRVNADTARMEGIIDETAERTSTRIAGAIKDLPAAIAHHMDAEIARIDTALQGSLFGLSDQMRQSIDAVPSRLSEMTLEMLRTLESSLEQTFESVAQRSQLLSGQFRDNATQTTEAVLQGYVDFVFLSVERFRKELEQTNASFMRDLEVTLAALPRSSEDTPTGDAMQHQPDPPAASPET